LKNRTGLCSRCRSINIQPYQIGTNNNDGEYIEDNNQQWTEYSNYITNRFNIYNKNLNNQGYIDNVKSQNSIRFIVLNPQGFSPKSIEKINIMS